MDDDEPGAEPILPDPPATRLAYSVGQAAELVGLSTYSIRLAIAGGELHAKRTRRDPRTGQPMGRVLILHSALEDWLNSLPDQHERWWAAGIMVREAGQPVRRR